MLSKGGALVHGLIGEKLRLLRKEKGETLDNVCTAVGIKNSTLSYYELSERNPNIAICYELAKYYGVSIDWLCGRTNKKEVAR